MADIQFFDRKMISLNRELAHPAHLEFLSKLNFEPGDKFEDKIGKLAGGLEVLMDGYYTYDDLVNLCPILEERLRKMRHDKTMIVIGPGDI